MIDLSLPILNVEPLLPHSGEMVLLDKITAFGEDFLHAETWIRENNLLVRNHVFSTFSCIELMAQAIGAWSGCMCVLANEDIRLGFLLGTRKFELYTQEIPFSTLLKIEVTMSMQDVTGFSVFDCLVKDKQTGNILAKGALNVYSPKETQLNLG